MDATPTPTPAPSPGPAPDPGAGEAATAVPTPDELGRRLGGVSLRDEQRLRRRLDRARSLRGHAARTEALDEVARAVAAAEDRAERRRATLPRISYPEDLPVSRRRDDLAAAIRDHQVVVVAGETGSGKTTQLPKICLELGRGIRGAIGHTQPRRIAARSVAERIAEELGTELGEAVGYSVRFTRQAGEDTLVRLMTDGILLAEIARDRLLRRYDTIIVDEAHERSLNIDFLLGYLHRLLPRRPELKVIITSATIDPQRFAAHFDNAPVVEVSGRTYPVEVRYRPVVDPDAEPGSPAADPDRDQVQAILDAVDELALEPSGDVLVFLSGEREIRDTADALRSHVAESAEVVPLYARLSAAEQHRVFAPHRGRRIVLATNVAETSLTVPGIRYVVDAGTARISRYSHRLKVQRLPIEPVSRASADQRKGRCGRTADGICIRLYTEADYDSRPEFTDPEILRTNLAAVILQMAALGLGEVADFPFLDPPDRRQVRDGVQLLEELGALDPRPDDPTKRLTPLGRRLAQLPVDPRFGRMVLEAERNGCVREVLVIAAALSIQDPRERPADQRQAADQQHARFADKDSDFLAYLNLWEYARERQRELSGSAFRRMCRAEHLHYLRIREWQDLVAQLRQAVQGLDITVSGGSAPRDRIHLSLLAGLLSHVGLLDPDSRDYQGARGARFAVFPGSSLFKKPPRWVMAAELVETTRLWARDCARIEPEWVEPLAEHLVKRTYSEPHWSRKRAAVVATERVTLYGVPIVTGRTVAYGRIDPDLSRELFVRHALVEGDWETRHRFFHANRALLEDVEDLEARARRRDIVVDDEALFDFYDARIPADVVSGRHFDAWWKKARHRQSDLLTFTRDDLVSDEATEVSAADYPDTWAVGDLRLRLTYQFEPGSDADGVTAHVPVEQLNQVAPEGFEWQVPGLREDLVTALLRSLPKAVRRQLVPAPDVARAVLPRLVPATEPPVEPLLPRLARELHRLRGVVVEASDFDLARVPDHLRVTFRVEDARGGALGEGKDLGLLAYRLSGQARAAVAADAASVERAGLTSWTVGTVPRTFERRHGARTVRGYPALVDEGGSVAVRVLASESDQARAMPLGTRRLLLLSLPSPVRSVVSRLPQETKLALAHSAYASVPALLDDCAAAAVDELVAQHGGPAWDGAAFAALAAAVRAGLPDRTYEVVVAAGRVLAEARVAEREVSGTSSLTLLPALADVRTQVAALVPAGFVSTVGAQRLPDLVRYLRAVRRRLETLPNAPVRDRERMERVASVQAAYEAALAALPPGRPPPAELLEVRWMIEELRVSLFAQTLGTPYPVSETRILRAMDAASVAGH
ncbi:MAG TPA: ATP-dependent RNA helicase HrpA [Jiangellales bacterium]|nr:ATP-dependent RNA helicase HrpA [Jiangellales bacterium]